MSGDKPASGSDRPLEGKQQQVKLVSAAVKWEPSAVEEVKSVSANNVDAALSKGGDADNTEKEEETRTVVANGVAKKRKTAHVAAEQVTDKLREALSAATNKEALEGENAAELPINTSVEVKATQEAAMEVKESHKAEVGSNSSSYRKRAHDDMLDDGKEGPVSREPKVGHRSRWQEMFLRLKDYKAQFGDCLVPNRYSPDPPLGHWVSSQRRQYKSLQTGQQGANAMSEERISKLESIGFEWETTDPRHVPWDVRYKELGAYVEEHGDAQVPMRWKENIQLSNWVSKQRHDYKLRQRGTSGRLTDERYKLLNDIGFVWEAAGKSDNRESEPPAQLPPHRPQQFEDSRSRESNSARNGSTSGSSGMRASPPHSAASHPREPSQHVLPPSQDIANLLANQAFANPAALMQAASLNQTKFQLAGLFPAANVGSGVRVPPGGLFTIPASNGISFIPVIQNYGAPPHMAQPPTAVATFHHVAGPPHGAHFPPFATMAPHTGAPHPPPHGIIMFHGRDGAARSYQSPARSPKSRESQPRKPVEHQPRKAAEQKPANRGADPPEG